MNVAESIERLAHNLRISIEYYRYNEFAVWPEDEQITALSVAEKLYSTFVGGLYLAMYECNVFVINDWIKIKNYQGKPEFEKITEVGLSMEKDKFDIHSGPSDDLIMPSFEPKDSLIINSVERLMDSTIGILSSGHSINQGEFLYSVTIEKASKEIFELITNQMLFHLFRDGDLRLEDIGFIRLNYEWNSIEFVEINSRLKIAAKQGIDRFGSV
jgi:hypothetical protein